MSSSVVPMVMRDFFLDDPFFQSTWEDFDKVRERMIEKSRRFWSDSSMMDSIENSNFSKSAEFSSSTSSSRKNESSMKSNFSSSNTDSKDLISNELFNNQNNGSSWMFPRGWLIPELRSEFKDINLFKENNTEVIRVINDEKKLEICLDTSQYKPSELKILVKNGIITIEGKHEEKAEDGSKMVSRQFIRRYTLPAESKAEDVVSNLSSDGVLVITVNKSSENDRIVEIKNADNTSTHISNGDYNRISSESRTANQESVRVENKKNAAKEFLSKTINSAVREQSQERHVQNDTSKQFEASQTIDSRKLNVPIKMKSEQIDSKLENTKSTQSVSNSASQDYSKINIDIKQSERSSVEKNLQNKPLKVRIVEDDKNISKISNESNQTSIASQNASRISEKKVASSERSEMNSFSQHQRSSSEERRISSKSSQDNMKITDDLRNSEDNSLTQAGKGFLDFNNKTGRRSLRSWFFPKFMEEKHSDIIKLEENDDKLELKLDASKYKPEELKVSVDHGMILVEGKHEEKAEDGHIMVSRQFSRKYSLPAGARAEDVVSNLSEEGVLVITAHKSKLYKEKVDVPIKKK